MHDFIEKKILENKLEEYLKVFEESKQIYSLLFSNAIEGICLHEIVYDDDKPINYKIIDVNPQYENILNIKKENIVNKLATTVYNTDTAPYLDIYANVVKTGKPIIFETYFPPLDSYFLISAFSLQKGQFATSFWDITSRKKLEQKVIKEKIRSETYFNIADVMLVVIDKNQKIELVNKKGCKVLEYAFDELIGKNWFETCLLESDKDAFQSAHKKLMEGDEEITQKLIENDVENYIVTKNGEHKLILWNNAIIRDDDESPIATISSGQDITEEKKVKDAIKKLNEELEIKVSERTIELEAANEELGAANEELGAANEELEATNEELEATNEELENTLAILRKTQNELIIQEKMASLGNLVAGVSHEINTPVGIGVTSVTYLKDTVNEAKKLYEQGKMTHSKLKNFFEDVFESSNIIFSNLKRASNIIKSFKQISIDQSTQEKRKFNLKVYIDEIMTSLRPQLKKTSHNISIDCEPDLKISSYPDAFFHIISNFVINSIKHGFENKKQGNIFIKIKIIDDFNNNKILVINYKDDGKGIDKKDLSKIFDPFFTTKRGYGGSGLGLNVVYNIVTQTLNGSIDCESKEGKYTSFCVKIPLDN